MVQRLDPTPVYESDLNETHTRYDYSRTIPNEESLHIQFAALAGINAVVATVCLVVIVSMVKSKKTRMNPFNMYILFTAIPDFVSSFCCMLTCAMSAPLNEYHGEIMCGFQSFYLTWGFTANCWMNGTIVYEIHKLLRFSHIRRRYHPRTRTQVLKQVAVVYLYAACLAFVGVWNIPWLPHKTFLYHGHSCFPLEYDLGSTLFYWLLFIPAFLLLPVIYTTFVMWDIYHRKLLPPMGRRRDLSIYFFRLVLVYYIMWMPFLLICTIGNYTALSSWIWWAGAAWSHLQGLVSSLVSLTKADIKSAVQNFVLCRPEEVIEGQSNDDIEESIRVENARRASVMESFRRILGRGSSFWFKQSYWRQEAAQDGKLQRQQWLQTRGQYVSDPTSCQMDSLPPEPNSVVAAISEVQKSLQEDYDEDSRMLDSSSPCLDPQEAEKDSSISREASFSPNCSLRLWVKQSMQNESKQSDYDETDEPSSTQHFETDMDKTSASLSA